MSGFLSRIAARAVGQTPIARPRLPSVFEGAHAEGGLEIVETEVVSRQASRAGTRPTETPPQRARAAQPVAADETGQPPASTRVEPEPPAAPARVREAETPIPATELPDTRELVTHIAERVVAVEPPTVTGVPSELVTQAEPAVAVAAAAPAARTTLEFSVRPATAQTTAAAGATAIAEQPTVRVHIGRLEVRANLQEAPAQRPRRAEPEPAGPSLSDYLRGRRTAP